MPGLPGREGTAIPKAQGTGQVGTERRSDLSCTAGNTDDLPRRPSSQRVVGYYDEDAMDKIKAALPRHAHEAAVGPGPSTLSKKQYRNALATFQIELVKLCFGTGRS